MKSNQLHIIYIIIIVILIGGMVGEYYYFHHKAEAMAMAPGGGQKMAMMSGGKGMPPMHGMSMIAVTPPPVSDQQTQQLTAGTSTSSTDKTFNITGGNFYFVPNKITVNQGDKVTFVMTNAGGIHDLVIDALGVKTPMTHTAQAATVTFTASKKGSFVYYCSVPGHKAKGMWGTLTVQ